MIPIKELVRAALQAQHALIARSTTSLTPLLDQFNRLRQRYVTLRATGFRLRKLRGHAWEHALATLKQDLRCQLQMLDQAATGLQDLLDDDQHRVVSLRELVDDLRQLDEEFGGLEINLRSHTLRVRTEPIVLEEIRLGTFAITLKLRQLRDGVNDCLEITAEDPNPPATNSDVTHPHVSHDKLCPGDATVALKRALEQGRFTDAFCLVRSVLDNYNPASAFVQLDVWHGEECHDCGRSRNSDDLSGCPHCGYAFCGDCWTLCEACDELNCHSCIEICQFCDRRMCAGCLERSAVSRKSACPDCVTTCSHCRKSLARKELAPGTDLCPTCLSEIPSDEPIHLPEDDADDPRNTDSRIEETAALAAACP